MDDLWLRVAVVVGAIAIAGAASLVLRRRGQHSVRQLEAVDLSAGVYYFSSGTCDTCLAARAALSHVLGSGAFTEFAWEEAPDVFVALGVDVVPATLVVTADGSATLHNGIPKTLPGTGDP